MYDQPSQFENIAKTSSNKRPASLFLPGIETS